MPGISISNEFSLPGEGLAPGGGMSVGNEFYFGGFTQAPILSLLFGLATYTYNGVTYTTATAMFAALGSYTGGVAGATVTRGDGTIASFAAANTPRVAAPSSVTNLILNSATFGTQTITVVSGVTYTLSGYGTAAGVLTCSGASTATLTGTGATNRVSTTFTATTGSLTITLTSGTWTSSQLDISPVARTYVATTGAVVTADDYTAVRGNLWLNSSGTQTITTVAGQKYTVSVGSAGGTVTLSGGGSGVASFGAPVTFTATTTSVTGTVASSPSLIQFEPVLYTNTTLTYPTPYIPTTSAAVYVYDTPVSGAGILIEDARSNLCLQSNAFTTTWTNTSGPTPVAAATLSPDQTVDAWSWTRTATTAQYNYQGVTSGALLAYTGSIYAKAGTARYLAFRLGSAAAPSAVNNVQAVFDLLAGTISALSNASWTLGSATIVPAANGFYRCTLTGTCDATANPSLYYSFNSAAGAQVDSAGTIGDSGYIYGAQLEQSAAPTSYIATTSATAARAQDVAYINMNVLSTPNWAWLNDIVAAPYTPGTNDRFASIDDGSGSSNNSIYQNFNNGQTVVVARQLSGGSQLWASTYSNVTLANGVLSGRTVLSANGGKVYGTANGSAATAIDGGAYSPTPAVAPTRVVIGGWTGGTGNPCVNGFVRRVQVWQGGNYSAAWLQGISA